MLEHLNIQSIAKWFEKGCTSLDTDSTNKNQEKGFYILECNDICLLSKLTEVKNHTLLERAHKQLQQIKEAALQKEFLLTLCNEFTRDGRRAVSLKMLTDEIDGQTPLFDNSRSDLLFHRALCLFKHEQPSEALSDLYKAFENGQIQRLDKVHVQILEEIKKYLTTHEDKFKEGFIMTEDKGQVTFEQVLKQYEKLIERLIEQQLKEHQKEANDQRQENQQEFVDEQQRQQQQQPDHNEPSLKEQLQHKWVRNVRPSFNGKTIDSGCVPKLSPCDSSELKPINTIGPTYKSKLVGEAVEQVPNNSASVMVDDQNFCDHISTYGLLELPNNASSMVMNYHENGDQTSPIPIGDIQTKQQTSNQKSKNENNNNNADFCKEFILSYTVNQETISVRNILNEPLIDNIFKLRAVCVDKLTMEAKIETVYEIFETFGNIINIKYKDNSTKLIIEYDNPESPRLAISYLSQIPLPYISEPNASLQFRFYKSENQRNLRICKQNQIKSSRECYFWRTTGCQNANCKFYHNKLAQGVDYQEWMKIEQLRSFRDKATSAFGSTYGGPQTQMGDRGFDGNQMEHYYYYY